MGAACTESETGACAFLQAYCTDSALKPSDHSFFRPSIEKFSVVVMLPQFVMWAAFVI